MRRLVVSTLALAVLPLAACTDEPGDPATRPDASSTSETQTPSPSPSPSPSAPGLPLPELTTTSAPVDVTTAARPAWTSSGIRGPKTIQVDGDLAVVATPRDQRGVDLRSGEVLWTLGDDEDLPLPGTTSAAGLVLAPSADGPRAVSSFYANGCAFGCPVPEQYHSEQKGIVALDATTGDVAWGRGLVGSAQADYLRPRDRDLDLVVAGVLSSPRAVVTSVGHGDIVVSGQVDADLPVYAVALDPVSGERLWARRGVVPEAVVADLVVVRVNDEAAPFLVGLDARTGEQRWRSPVTSPFLALQSVSPRVIAVEAEDSDAITLLDTRTGVPLAAQPPGVVRFCAAWVSGSLDLACEWSAPDEPSAKRLLTLDATGSMSLSAEPLTSTPDRVVDGVVVADDVLEGPTVFLDAAGDRVGDDRPGRIESLSARYLVEGTEVRYGNELRTITVLRRR
ncbi:PQQ-binding-like beta-propeller repeat protein [Nocardioides sp. C4-1]|uniref:outer membrane protein assembly factor BamB family protein n=1 Tax=Nocardioides sp. C4-1 TaxID=3151851 RepID=UPI0032651E76